MNSSTTITKIAPALLKAQKEMGNAVKDSNNPFFKSKFADLNSVREAVTPALHANGISILQLNVTDALKGNSVQTVLLHESGEYITSDTPIVCKEANNPQQIGSAISYARRYGLASMLSIGADDDDGNKSSGIAVTPTKTSGFASAPPTSNGTSNGFGGGGSFRKPKTETVKNG